MIRRGVALLLAGIVGGLCIPGPAAAAPRLQLEHVHSSSRFDRSPASLARSIARLSPGADVMTLTEVHAARRWRVVRRAPGWDAYRVGDVAVMWRPSWSVLSRSRLRLAPGQWAALVVLRDPAGRRVVVTVAHLPSHVEYGDHWRATTPKRGHTWRTAVARWSRIVDRTRARWDPALTLVVADWNVNVRSSAWRRVLRSAFPTLRLTWRGPLPHAGTHAGRRLIDATLTDGRGRAHLARDDRSSDHRPYRERLT